jgi:cytochrome c biogenesis protein CcdA/thiol-disulfide isomerase/thioredoxin
MILLLGFSFLAGFVTMLAPCIWPVLPIVLSSSVAGGKGYQRPLGITLGVMLSFSIFTLLASYIIRILNLDPNVLRILAVVIITFLGFLMIIPALGARFELLVSRFSNIFGQKQANTDSGFIPGFISGLYIGIIWSPCAGPILATIVTLAATGQVSLSVVLITLAYVIGLGIPLFALSYGGQQIITRARGINKYTKRIQQVFGVIMILAAVAIYTNYDQTIQMWFLNKVPALGIEVNGFETSDLVTNQLDIIQGKKSLPTLDTTGLFNTNSQAPDFVGITDWLNTDKPLSIKDLKGTVVLVDFWSYTCINCIRTIPYINSWYEKYKEEGFVVIGVHAPESPPEYDAYNVENAIKMYAIGYPVAQDNDFATWNNYNNKSWPTQYLIDANGFIRRIHSGEGEYDQMEKSIQALLLEAGK